MTPPPLPPKAPVDARSVSLVVIAVLASLFALHWASAVIVPLLPVLVGVFLVWALVHMARRPATA